MITNELNELTILARAVALPAAAATAPEWIMYMPGGAHHIDPEEGGERSLHITAADAVTLNDDLQRLIAAGGPPPFFGFDHVNGRASAWPQEIAWRDGNVMARVRWTPDGEAAVTVKSAGQLPAYRYFSPGFRVNKTTGRITGLWPSEAGSLVNDPAFRAIARVSASQTKTVSAPADPNQRNENQNMKLQLIADTAIKCGLLTITEAAGDSAGTLLEERVNALRSDARVNASAGTDLRKEKERADKAEEALKKHRESRAKDAVETAVKAGRLAPKDETAKAFWIRIITADDSDESVKALNALPNRVPAPADAAHPGTEGYQTTDPGDESAAVKARSAQVAAKALEIQKETGSSYANAFAQAQRLIPAAS
jgi:hypothetical protein